MLQRVSLLLALSFAFSCSQKSAPQTVVVKDNRAAAASAEKARVESGSSPLLPQAGAPSKVANPASAVTPVPMTSPFPSNTASGECPKGLSIGRFQDFLAGEGEMIPAVSKDPNFPTNLLTKEGAMTVAKVEFIGNDWHVVTIYLVNNWEGETDLSGSGGFNLTYSSTEDLYLQMRPGFDWNGGNKYSVIVPSTKGEVKSYRFSFSDENLWQVVPELGMPKHPYAQARQHARGFVLVGNKPNKLTIYNLKIDAHTPPCK